MVIVVTGDAGHGLYTPGKRTPDDEREWSFNDKVIRAFEAELNNYEGVTFKRLDDPTGQTDVPLKTRTDKANALGSKVHVSFHHNANVGTYWGNWGGVETFVYKTSLSDAMELAKAVHSKNVNAYGLRDRGIKPSDLHMLRETNMTAILTEGGFMDSTTDIVKLRNDTVLRNSGIAIAQGVASYLGLKRKTPVAPPQPTYTRIYTGGYGPEVISEVCKALTSVKMTSEMRLGSDGMIFFNTEPTSATQFSAFEGYLKRNKFWYEKR